MREKGGSENGGGRERVKESTIDYMSKDTDRGDDGVKTDRKMDKTANFRLTNVSTILRAHKR